MGTTPPTRALGIGAKIFVWLAGILAAVNIGRFFTTGQTDDLLTGIGLALIAYGTWRNDFGRPRDAAGEPLPVDRRARMAALLGIGLVLAGLVLESRV
ncbi:MAG: hypothetical protein LOX98_02500 [Lysobacter sp.]|jgi:hypothetical protein|uniref:Uncharacterized protein n=2 Tax=Lysobacteraceae TaxID=32033 RepID=A0ABU7YS43_9GAMM|nr:hypothetical protein [Lysobacter luteus]MDV3254289.1 hypothetical protein [Lysobacter sp.]MDV5980287.1 hypothetical protein [Lysobacter sp.]CAG4967598.1 hypothetical protein LYB30171_00077 [Lysobacter luteus]